MTASRPPHPLSTYDSVLGPVAKTNRESSPRIVVLTLACRALTADIPPSVLRRWITSRCPGPVADYVSNRARFGDVIASSRKHVARSSSLDGRARSRLAAARRIVGCLLSPVPETAGLSPQRTVAARRALAVIGQEFLKRSFEDGFDTILVSAPWLAVRLGCRRGAASSALSACMQAGWVRKMPTRRGTPQRYKLCRLSAERSAIAWAHSDLVDALVIGDTTHPWVEVIRAADHPAIGYGTRAANGQQKSAALGAHAWLVGLCMQADVDPIEIGMTPKTVRLHRTRWMDALSSDERSIVDALDAYAATTGADGGRDAAEQRWLDEVAERLDEIARDRERKATFYSDQLPPLLAAHSIPTVSQTPPRAWAQAITAAATCLIPAETRPLLAKEIAKRMKKGGWPDAVAVRVGRHVAGLLTAPNTGTTPNQEVAA